MPQTVFLGSSDEDGEEEEEEEEEEASENLMELDRPLTADETRRLAESWKKRYSTDPADRNHDSPHDSIPESMDCINYCIH